MTYNLMSYLKCQTTLQNVRHAAHTDPPACCR